MSANRRVGEAGAALVEATLVLPVLLLLVAGIAETSLYFWTAGLAGKAVQLGVRKAIVSPPIALGPGLASSRDGGIWDGLPAGARCADLTASEARCPTFSIRCNQTTGCRCPDGGPCGFSFSEARLRPILRAMRSVLPNLRPEDVSLSYETNGFGYVTRPGPVPVDVEVTLTGYGYRPVFFGDLIGSIVAIDASARLPGESLGDPS